MNNAMRDCLTLFADNVGAIKNDFNWHGGAIKRLAAFVYTLEGKRVDVDAIKESLDLIKSETGIFSAFRGMLAVYMAAALSLAERPDQLLRGTVNIYDDLKRDGFWTGEYLALSAFEIAVNAKPADHAKIISRSRDFYNEMKANHRFIMSRDNYIYAAMFALSDMDPRQAANKLKRLYQQLKSKFSIFMSRGSVLTLSKMLVLGESTDECVLRLLRLNANLRHNKIRLDRSLTLPALGVLGMLDADSSGLVNDIIEARDFLRSQKGFGPLSVCTQELLLFAVSMVVKAYADDIAHGVMKPKLTTKITNLIIAQQMAIIIAMISTSAAMAASSGC